MSGDARASDPLVGRVLDSRYRVTAVLGQGGMGTVYEVRHQTLERSMALKVLRGALARDASLCQRFIREARVAAAIDHPGVVKISDFGALPSGEPYFVMELLRGPSLTHVMAPGRPLPLERVVSIVEQLVDALRAAHEKRVIHRDLKPDNIQILSDAAGRDVVKILDFGLARMAGAQRLTHEGLVFGTPHYMSPEQALGDNVDHRADIYALGVLMYEMVTGQQPFDADSATAVLTAHISTPPLRPSKLLKNRALGALEEVILRCLEKRPEKRYQSLAEMAVDLERAVTRSPLGIQPRRRLPRRSLGSHASQQAQRRALGWVMVGGGLSVLGAVGYRLLASPEAELPTELALPDPAAKSSAAPAVAARPEPGQRAGTLAEGRAAGTRTRIDSAVAARLPGSRRSPRAAPASASGQATEHLQGEPWQADPRGLPSSEPEHEQKLAPGAGLLMHEAPEARDVAPEPLPTTEIIDPWARPASQ